MIHSATAFGANGLFAQQAVAARGSFPGINGFLGTRASIMLDLVALAMFVVLALLGLSIYLVHKRQQYAWHKRIQVSLGMLLLLTVAAFEIDMQWLTRWELRAAASPYFVHNYSPATTAVEKYRSTVGISLLVHLLFAVPSALLWVFVIVQALRHFPEPPRPSPYSRRHATWGWLAAIWMTGTALTGWVFYYLAFVAT
ncbi:MAG: DUF420 domain-containing protein [Planctomycetia bacterium]|nr:DUF420 domain-containing protein [Planctomycetia bacterium]